MFRVFQFVTGLDPREDLCSRRRKACLQAPFFLCQFVPVCVLRYVVPGVNREFGPLQSLVAGRVRSAYEDRSGPVPLLHYLSNDLAVTSPAVGGYSIKGPNVNRFVPTRNFFPFTLCVFARSHRGVALRHFFILRTFLSRALLAGQALLPVHFPDLVPARVGVPKKGRLRRLIGRPLRRDRRAVISYARSRVHVVSSRS